MKIKTLHLNLTKINDNQKLSYSSNINQQKHKKIKKYYINLTKINVYK